MVAQKDNTTLARRSKEPAIIQQLRSERMRAEIAAALPRHITPERMLRMAITAMRQTPKLAECTQQSVF